MRYSHQRELILREVQARRDHPTAEQICTSLRAECPRLSLGTVYRDLNTLVEIGKVRRVSVPGEADRFDGEVDVHQHLWCARCHCIESLYIPAEKIQALVDECPHIQAQDWSLTVFGLCSRCAAQQEE